MSIVESEQKLKIEHTRCTQCEGGMLTWVSLSKAVCNRCGTKYEEYWKGIWVIDDMDGK